MKHLFQKPAPPAGMHVGAAAVTMPFGKYKGLPLGQIVEQDLLYLDWLIGQEIRLKHLQTAVFALHEKHSAEIERLLEEQGGRGE